MRRRQWAVLVLWVSGTVALAAAMPAFACTNLASINLSSTFGQPGDAIVITGSGFSGGVEAPMEGMDMSAMDMSNMGSTVGLAARPAVLIRWNGPSGSLLTSAIPDRTGNISVTVTVPETQPGHYSLVAVQKNAQGYDVYGTPARAPFQVTANGRAPRDATSGAVAGAADGNQSTGIILLTIALGAAGLGMFAAGGIAAVRQLSRRRVPAAARTHPT